MKNITVNQLLIICFLRDEDKLVAYAGLCPRVQNSNETVHHGRITKMGNKLMRKLLVQCAWVSIRYNPIMKAQYESLRYRYGKYTPGNKSICLELGSWV